MREIKFRLRNHRDGKMYVFDPHWGNYYHGDGWVGAIPFEDERVTYAPSNRIQLEPESCDWMEFTGLFDKNGKEIYEGDILKTSTGNNQVLWDDKDGLWCFDERCPVYFADINQREVIGNIYENPELTPLH